jgi:hypothetical protein
MPRIEARLLERPLTGVRAALKMLHRAAQHFRQAAAPIDVPGLRECAARPGALDAEALAALEAVGIPSFAAFELDRGANRSAGAPHLRARAAVLRAWVACLLAQTPERCT